MASDKTNFERPIRLLLEPSKWVKVVIYFCHIGALVCIYLSNIPLFIMQMAWFMILISLVYWHVTIIFQPKKYPAELLLNDKDEWYIIDNKAESYPVALLPESFVHTHLLVLIFKQGKRKRVVILTTDNTRPETFRRLSVRLRFTLSGDGP
jgi:hypothetical protein